MSKELQRTPNGAIQTVDMQAVMDIARDPTFDAAKLHALLDFQQRLDARAREAAFNEAMARMQPLLPTIDKKGKINIVKNGELIQSTPYARYEDIDKAIRPLMMEEGFSFSFTSAPPTADGKLIITATLRHRDGHGVSATVPLALESSGSKNNTQAMGSTISYGKRYLVCMLLNIVTEGEDIDGNSPKVDAQQATNLVSLMDAAELTPEQRKKFLKWLRADKPEDVLVNDYERGSEWLKKRTK